MTLIRKCYLTCRYFFSFLTFQTKSYTLVCFYIGVLCLTLQFFIFLMIMYTLEEDEISFSTLINKKCSVNIHEDINILSSTSVELGFNLIILDKQILKGGSNQIRRKQCIYCVLCKPIIIAVDNSALMDLRMQVLSKLIAQEFVPVTFYNTDPTQKVPELKNVDTVTFLQRTATFQMVMFHPREDNTWWFGNIRSDTAYEAKLASLNLTFQDIDLMKTEGAVEKFEMVPSSLSEESSLLTQPKDVQRVLSDIEDSKFIECNITRAALFHNKFGSDKSVEAVRFRHKVWKMLSRVKTILDSLGVVFWLSSGTALGYFRECDIIAHSKDVDIGVWASSYSQKLVTEIQDHGFHLKISLGFPNDSLELSFIDQSGIKLDIFFFYKDNDHYWNGGTQVKSGKKFKYTFPKFTLCWTLFKDLRVRVPCETEAYIRANYGSNWFTPVKTWDWKTSPANVQPNGVWKPEQLADAIKLFV